MEINYLSGASAANISDIKTTNKTEIEGENFQKALDIAIENGEDAKLKEASIEFESYFLNMMMKSMRKTIETSEGVFKKSNGEILFQEMLDEQMCSQAAKTGGIGLADMIYKQLSSTENTSIDYKQ